MILESTLATTRVKSEPIAILSGVEQQIKARWLVVKTASYLPLLFLLRSVSSVLWPTHIPADFQEMRHSSLFRIIILVIYSTAPLLVHCIRRKSSHTFQSDETEVAGQYSPLGPLANSYYAKLRLPGFPFEFPPIIPGTIDRYLIFPAPDTLADHAASQRRCEVYQGSLVQLVSVVEMQILACAIGTPSFVGGWFQTPEMAGCIVLHPGGTLSISPNNCNMKAGSICKIPKSQNIEGFQI